MDREKPSFSNRAGSFPNFNISRRPTNRSLSDGKGFPRQGTWESDGRRLNKKLRQTIPLWHRRQVSGDEENGHEAGYLESSGSGNKEGSRSLAGSSPPELLEIISTKWVSDDDGREIVTLATKDGLPKEHEASNKCESRWTHIKSAATTFKEFFNHVMDTPGLDDDDLRLALWLLRKVQKTNEKHFVHGRYLKPLTLCYEAVDARPNHQPKISKTGTFVSLPFFTIDRPQTHASTRDDDLHPVRALLQSHYRVQSTKRRDQKQVITKSKLHEIREDHIVHVPQIWALIINKHTVITCAPLNSAMLRGDTIMVMSYAEAQLDEAIWSVQFTDAQGNVSYLPLRTVKSFFSLVKHISDDILHDEHNLVRDQLLKKGPLYKLVTKENTLITAESWPEILEKKKTEVIRLRMIESLVTRCDPEGNELEYPSDPGSDTSATFSSDCDESDTSEASTQSSTVSGLAGPALKKLRGLRAKLKKAEDRGDTKRAEQLRDREIPKLEDTILDLIHIDLEDGYISQRSIHQATKDMDPGVIILDSEGHLRGGRRRSASSSRPYWGPSLPRGFVSWSRSRSRSRLRLRARSRSRLSPSPRSRARSGLRSRSRLMFRSSSEPRSRSRSVSPYMRRHHYHSRSAHDLSVSRLSTREHQWRPYLVKTKARSAPRRREDYYKDHEELVEYNNARRFRTDSPPRFRTLSPPALSRVSSTHTLSRSLQPLARSSVYESESLGHRGGQSDLVEGDIYYKPSEKHLARSRWDFLRSRLIAGHMLDKSEGQSVDKPSINESASEGNATAGQSVVGQESFPIEPRPSLDTGVNHPSDEPAKRQGKNVICADRPQEIKPRLKRLVNLAKTEAPTLSTAHTQGYDRVQTLPITDQSRDIPIFLWSTDRSILKGSASAPRHADASRTPMEGSDPSFSTSKTEELILHTVTTEAHAYLRKSKYIFSSLYDKTRSKSLSEIVDVMDKMKSNPFRHPGSSNSSTTLLDRDAVMSAKQGIFDSAIMIMHAFVPEGYEASVVFKYWGALYKLLSARDEEVLPHIDSRLTQMCELLRDIQMGVRADDGSKQARYQIPQALPLAFQSIVLSLVIISHIDVWSDRSWSRMQSAFNESQNYLLNGRKQLSLMVHTDDYGKSTSFGTVDSEALLSLILANLVDILSLERGFHLTDVYTEYSVNLQSVLHDQAFVKVSDDVRLFQEELDVIIATLKQQQEVLNDFKRTINTTHGVFSMSISVIDRMLYSVEQRIEEFDELQARAETARFLAQQLNTDSNNRAIVVFTVVTIIFLPLSFVTSYLGMNTSDLRTMTSGQTLFWAIGVPVTFVTFSVALLAAYYGTLTQRLTPRTWRGKEKAD